MTTKDKSGKQKDIHDVLLSIDSLLDTATDVEPLEQTDSRDKNKTQKNKTGKKSAVAKTPGRLKSENKPTTAQRTPAHTSKKAASTPVEPKLDTKPSAKATTKSKTDSAATADSHNVSESSPYRRDAQTGHRTVKPTIKSDAGHLDQTAPDKSLNFTTVDEDLSPVRRDLPVLDDVVTAEDLSLIGSGKEPPKKILTEKFQRRTTTDKIIDLLEDHLSDYNISKLEYKYLHELIDELLAKNKKP